MRSSIPATDEAPRERCAAPDDRPRLTKSSSVPGAIHDPQRPRRSDPATRGTRPQRVRPKVLEQHIGARALHRPAVGTLPQPDARRHQRRPRLSQPFVYEHIPDDRERVALPHAARSAGTRTGRPCAGSGRPAAVRGTWGRPAGPVRTAGKTPPPGTADARARRVRRRDSGRRGRRSADRVRNWRRDAGSPCRPGRCEPPGAWGVVGPAVSRSVPPQAS